MVKPTDSSYRNRGVAENFSSFEKNSVESAMKTSRSSVEKSGTGKNHQFPRNNLRSTDSPHKTEDVRHTKGTTLVSQSSIVSRKNDQWNVKRDIPVGTVRNNQFIPEPKQQPPQLHYQKKQWDTSNIPKGSVAARIQESNSPRKKRGGNKPTSPTKLTGGSNKPTIFSNSSYGLNNPRNTEVNSSTISPRGFYPKSGNSSWQNQPKSLARSPDQNLTEQKSSHRIINDEKEKRGGEPSPKIPNGAVKGRISALYGQSASKGTKPKDILTLASINTYQTDYNSKVASSTNQDETILEEAKLNNDEDQWIISDRNAANTQVFASDWGEAIHAKSAESDDWDTPAKEWIRSGESQTEVFSSNELKSKVTKNREPSFSTEIAHMPDETVPQFENGNARNPGDFPPQRTMTQSILAPPPKDANAYHEAKERSFVNDKSSQDRNFGAKSHSSFSQDFNNGFENFATKPEMILRDDANQQLHIIKSSDVFGFPVSSANKIVENRNIGEIVGGDEFFDASVLPNDYGRSPNDDLSFELPRHSSMTSTISAEDDAFNNLNEFNSGKGDSKKKRKGFFKGLFGRKSKENGEQLTKDNQKLQIRKERRYSKSSIPDSLTSEASLQNSNKSSQSHDITLSNQKGRKSGSYLSRLNGEHSVESNPKERISGSRNVNTVANHFIGDKRGDKDEHHILKSKSQDNCIKESTNEYNDTFSTQNNAFKEFIEPEFSTFVDGNEFNANNFVTSTNMIQDDIFDDLEPDITGSRSVKEKTAVDTFLDPRLDHLDSNIDSEEESNGDITGRSHKNKNMLMLPPPPPPPPRKQKNSEQEFRMEEELPHFHQNSSDGKQSRNAWNETTLEKEKKSVVKNVNSKKILKTVKPKSDATISSDCNPETLLNNEKSARRYESEKERNVAKETNVLNAEREEPLRDERYLPKVGKSQAYFGGSKPFRVRNDRSRENVTSKRRDANLEPQDPSKASLARNLASNMSKQARLHDLNSRRKKDAQKSHVIRGTSPAINTSSNLGQTRLGDHSTKLGVFCEPKLLKKETAQSSKFSSREGDGTHSRISEASTTQEKKSSDKRKVVTSISSKSMPPSRPNAHPIYFQHSFVGGSNLSLENNLLPNRYTKNSVFNKVLNVHDAVREDGRRGMHQQELSYDRRTRSSKRNGFDSQYANRKMDKDGTNSKKFSRAVHAYNSITKKNLSEDSEDERKYLSIPAASTSASDISCSSTYDSYQKKLAESLKKANIVTKNSSEYSIHSHKSLDDSSIESDIRILRSILRRPRLDHDNESVIRASRQIEGFPTYDTESATDPMQRVGLRLLSSAIIPIQTEVRRFLAMRHALTRMWALIVVQTYTRRFLAQKHFHKALNSAVTIQGVVRGHLARNDVIDKHICAIEIQRFVRGYLATMQVYEDIYKVTLVQSLVRTRIAMDYAAYRMSLLIQLQAIARGFLARRRRAHLDSCATLVQSSWRSFYNRLTYQFDLLDIIIVQSLWRKKLGVRVAVRKVEEKRNSSATLIQAEWRAYDCRVDFLCYISARTIQTKWRSYICKKNLIDHQSSTIIQSAARMFLCRLQYVDYQAAMVIQSLARMYFCRIDYADYQCAKKIQSVLRMFSCRAKYREYQSASKIQSIGRMYLCRYDYLEYRAATTLQSAIRMFLCRSGYVEYQAASKIQSIGRMYLCRYDYLEYRAATTLQSVIRMFLCRSGYVEHQAASKIQSIGRMYLCRHDYLEYRAATTLQSVIRMFLCRSEYVEYQAASKVQSIVRMHYRRHDYLEYRAATTLQSAIRMYFCRSDYIEYQSATIIQTTWRSHDCRMEYILYTSSRKLQSIARMYLCRIKYTDHQVETASRVIQTRFRSFYRRKEYIRFTSARQIQTRWRAYMCRKIYIENFAATMIQAKWRSYDCSSMYKRYCSARAIQKTWRSYDCQMNFLHFLADILIVQSTIRRFLVQRRVQAMKNHAATVIQRNYRCHACFTSYTQTVSAIAIQRTWRGFVCFADYEEFKAARKVQNAWRRYVNYKSYTRHIAARKMQSAWRGFHYYNAYKRHEASIKIQSGWRGLICYIDYHEYLTVRRIQSAWRAYVCRRNNKRQKASILIQCTWRGFLCYADYMFELSDIVVVQKQIRGWLAKRVADKRRSLLRNTAAIIIQKHWRRMVNETRFVMTKRTQHASTVIQTCWRRFWCFSNFMIALDCSIQIQAHIRGHKQRKDYLCKQVAAIAIETAWRNAQAKKLNSQLSVIREITNSSRELADKQSSAAIKVQQVFRGSLCRNALKVHLAVVLIQSRVRGKHARVAVRLYIAVRKIQAVWRAFTPHQSYKTYIAARKIQATWRSYIPRQDFITFIAARCIQNSWRHKKATQDILLLRREFDAASLIQSVWRTFVSYTDFVFTLSDIVVAQRVARGYLSRKKYYGTIRSNIDKTKGELNGAIAIQKIYRGFQSRQNYWYKLGCTMQIQSWWRGRRVYRRIQKEASALLILQCFIRCSLARQEYMQRRFVFMLIQTAELERSKKLKLLKMKEQVREDMEERQRDVAARVIQHFFLDLNRYHIIDQLVLAAKRRKKWRKNMKKEQHTDDVEEALLEDVWVGLVAQSSLEEEPFTRHYTNFGHGSVRIGTQKYNVPVNNMVQSVVKLRDEADDVSDFSQLIGPTMASAPQHHPTSSTRMIRKVDANDMDDDFQLEEAFIDAEIFHAKKRRHYAGRNYVKKISTRSGTSWDARPSREDRSSGKKKNSRNSTRDKSKSRGNDSELGGNKGQVHVLTMSNR